MGELGAHFCLSPGRVRHAVTASQKESPAERLVHAKQRGRIHGGSMQSRGTDFCAPGSHGNTRTRLQWHAEPGQMSLRPVLFFRPKLCTKSLKYLDKFIAMKKATKYVFLGETHVGWYFNDF
ncbi:hypothetical protein NDU88_008012 [Pleurodeles waltl]|uniref:Uncharacterized protein n=1 Tax=Pleurodeles waltl TaxID=8319 RepID=A0AAV7N5Y4_PLEWA|nr:hypothetical protein NDU88_008012 [Pleurodeles waltl]